jgi:glyoxylase-like metal-dependent hydrolase (beta-lactamase superfamily II)
MLLALGGLAAVKAQQPPANAPKVIDVEKVKDNLYVFRGDGGGGNTAVFLTANGVVVVDAKNPGWGTPILNKIKELTSKPVTMLINTHTHGDHVSGNVEFPSTVDIVTQENTKTLMDKMAPVYGSTSQNPPAPTIFQTNNGKGLPTKTFKDKLSLLSGKDRIELHYFGRGHTGGDTFVVFPALRAMHAGDMFAWKDAPIMDLNNGGSGLEFPKTLGKAVSGIKNVDTVIVGHSPVRTWAEFEEYQRYMSDLVGAAQQALKAGKSVDDAASSINLTSKYKDYQSMRVKAAVQAINDEMKKPSTR